MSALRTFSYFGFLETALRMVWAQRDRSRPVSRVDTSSQHSSISRTPCRSILRRLRMIPAGEQSGAVLPEPEGIIRLEDHRLSRIHIPLEQLSTHLMGKIMVDWLRIWSSIYTSRSESGRMPEKAPSPVMEVTWMAVNVPESPDSSSIPPWALRRKKNWLSRMKGLQKRDGWYPSVPVLCLTF